MAPEATLNRPPPVGKRRAQRASLSWSSYAPHRGLNFGCKCGTAPQLRAPVHKRGTADGQRGRALVAGARDRRCGNRGRTWPAPTGSRRRPAVRARASPPPRAGPTRQHRLAVSAPPALLRPPPAPASFGVEQGTCRVEERHAFLFEASIGQRFDCASAGAYLGAHVESGRTSRVSKSTSPRRWPAVTESYARMSRHARPGRSSLYVGPSERSRRAGIGAATPSSWISEW